jgi:hypothetical protein
MLAAQGGDKYVCVLHNIHMLKMTSQVMSVKPVAWQAMHAFYRTFSNANPFRYSVSGIMGMTGWSGLWE